MARKILFGLSAVLFTVVFTLGGSGGGSLAAEKVEPINLKVASWNPPQVGIALVEKEWKRIIEERSGGRIQLTFYWAASLAKPLDVYRTGKSGVADIIYWVIGQNPGVTPLNEVISLPFMGADSMESITDVLHALWKKYPSVEEEIGLKVLWSCAMPPYHFHFTKKEVRLPQDIAGMKLLVGSAYMDMARELQVVPVQKGPTDWYMSLQRGLVEGHILHFPGLNAFKCLPLFSSHTLAGLGGVGMSFHGMFMNYNVWNKLPPDIQDIFMDLSEWVEDEHMKVDTEEHKRAVAEVEKMGHKMIYLTPDELAIWAEATKPVHEAWIRDQEKAGRPIAREIYNETMRLIPIYNGQ